MTKRTSKFSQIRPILLVFLGIIGLTVLLAVLLRGKDVALLNPKGYVADGELRLMLFTVALFLTAAVPTIFILYSFVWRYRDSNEDVAPDPQVRENKKFVFAIWAIPSIFVIILALVLWPATHRLAPRKPIITGVKPLTIQVVAMRWKWVFIYPEQSIAAVNFVQIPLNTPIRFELTAVETPMSSFWIPHLSGQLYAMTGHVNPLNLIADKTGDYPGSSAEINGAGFAGMKFTARVSSGDDFTRWVRGAQSSSSPLDTAVYEKLLIPSENQKAALYGTVEQGLYAKMLMKYAASHDHQSQREEATNK